MTRKMNVGFRPSTATALEALCRRRGWKMNTFVDDAVRARLREHGVELDDD